MSNKIVIIAKPIYGHNQGLAIGSETVYAHNMFIRHNENYAAVIYYINRENEWWLHDKKLNVKTQEEYKKYMKLAAMW